MAMSNLPLPLEFHNGEEPLTVELPLSKGFVAIIDAIDGDLAGFKWCVQGVGQQCRPVRWIRKSGKKTHVLLYRVIMERVIGRTLHENEFVDHADGNPMNNTRSNLRVCTPAENTRNRRVHKNNATGLKGVKRYHKKWKATITIDKRVIDLGSYNSPEEAHEAYCEAAKKYHSEFARFE